MGGRGFPRPGIHCPVSHPGIKCGSGMVPAVCPRMEWGGGWAGNTWPCSPGFRRIFAPRDLTGPLLPEVWREDAVSELVTVPCSLCTEAGPHPRCSPAPLPQLPPSEACQAVPGQSPQPERQAQLSMKESVGDASCGGGSPAPAPAPARAPMLGPSALTQNMLNPTSPMRSWGPRAGWRGPQGGCAGEDVGEIPPTWS